MPLNLSETLFDGEADAAVLRLGAERHLIRDLDFYWRTSDAVSSGVDPHTGKRLTASGLKAWVARCQHDAQPPHLKEPKDDPTDHPAVPHHPHRPLRNAGP